MASLDFRSGREPRTLPSGAPHFSRASLVSSKGNQKRDQAWLEQRIDLCRAGNCLVFVSRAMFTTASRAWIVAIPDLRRGSLSLGQTSRSHHSFFLRLFYFLDPLRRNRTGNISPPIRHHRCDRFFK